MYWLLSDMYSENFGFGPGGFIIRGTFLNRMRGLDEPWPNLTYAPSTYSGFDG